MTRFLYVASTLFIGFFLQFICTRYLSFYDASPQVLLLLVVTQGFLLGPIMGQTLGFFWGLFSDATGVHLFGMNIFLLSAVGYISGSLRRRVASERPTAQLVVALVATCAYEIMAAVLFSIFEEVRGRSTVVGISLRLIFNFIFITGLFHLTERWIELWKMDHEHS